MHPHLIHAIILQSYNRGGRDIIVKKVTNFLPVIFQVLMEANGLLHKKNNNNKKKGINLLFVASQAGLAQI